MIAHDEDILTSILIWLPLNLLIRFKLVSKQWCSLISSDHFSHLHTLLHHRRRRRRQPSLLLRLAGRNNSCYLHLNHLTQKLVPYHFPPNLPQPIVESSSNGLLFLQIRTPPGEDDLRYVYNPTSRKSRRIELRSHERFVSVLGLSLAFDPAVSLHYKIICVRATRRRSRAFVPDLNRYSVIDVYDADTGEWSLIGEPFWVPFDVDFIRGVYLNGCVHWRGLFFDVKEGVVREHPKLETPGLLSTERFDDLYVESRGHLHYLLHYQNTNLLKVFELESDFSEWSLKYRVVLDGVPRMVSVVEKEEEDGEGSALVLFEAGKFMVYGFKQGETEEIVDFRDEVFYEEGGDQFVTGCGFTETLASV